MMDQTNALIALYTKQQENVARARRNGALSHASAVQKIANFEAHILCLYDELHTAFEARLNASRD